MTKDEALKLTLEALKIARDQIVDPEYGPIGWDVSRLDEVLSIGKQALAAQQEPDVLAHAKPTQAQLAYLPPSPDFYAPPQLERNFCERCGKRTADLTVIHTCTPPQE
jgi:hypothetical protein